MDSPCRGYLSNFVFPLSGKDRIFDISNYLLMLHFGYYVFHIQYHQIMFYIFSIMIYHTKSTFSMNSHVRLLVGPFFGWKVVSYTSMLLSEHMLIKASLLTIFNYLNWFINCVKIKIPSDNWFLPLMFNFLTFTTDFALCVGIWE